MGGLLGKVQAKWCQGGDSYRMLSSRKLELAKTMNTFCQAGDWRLSLRMHALRTAWSQDVTRLRMAFLKENDGHGHDCLFCFGIQILLLYGGYLQRSPVDPSGGRNAGLESILHQHDECSRSSHTSMAFSWRNRSLETVQAQKKKYCIKAAAYEKFFNFLVRFLFKCSFYLRAAYMQSHESAKPVNEVWHM